MLLLLLVSSTKKHELKSKAGIARGPFLPFLRREKRNSILQSVCCKTVYEIYVKTPNVMILLTTRLSYDTCGLSIIVAFFIACFPACV